MLVGASESTRSVASRATSLSLLHKLAIGALPDPGLLPLSPCLLASRPTEPANHVSQSWPGEKVALISMCIPVSLDRSVCFMAEVLDILCYKPFGRRVDGLAG